MALNHSLRLTFNEAELLQATLKQAIEGAGLLIQAGTRDTVTAVSFLGVEGYEMDELSDEAFRGLMVERVAELKALSAKLKRICGV